MLQILLQQNIKYILCDFIVYWLIFRWRQALSAIAWETEEEYIRKGKKYLVLRVSAKYIKQARIPGKALNIISNICELFQRILCDMPVTTIQSD